MPHHTFYASSFINDHAEEQEPSTSGGFLMTAGSPYSSPILSWWVLYHPNLHISSCHANCHGAERFPKLSRMLNAINWCNILQTRKRFRDCSLRVFALGMQASSHHGQFMITIHVLIILTFLILSILIVEAAGKSTWGGDSQVDKDAWQVPNQCKSGSCYHKHHDHSQH